MRVCVCVFVFVCLFMCVSEFDLDACMRVRACVRACVRLYMDGRYST